MSIGSPLTFCHARFRRKPDTGSRPSSRALPQLTQSVPASSPPAREFPPALSATALLRAGAQPTAPRVLPIAASPAEHRVPLPLAQLHCFAPERNQLLLAFFQL